MADRWFADGFKQISHVSTHIARGRLAAEARDVRAPNPDVNRKRAPNLQQNDRNSQSNRIANAGADENRPRNGRN
jgi:hypothetical protein